MGGEGQRRGGERQGVIACSDPGLSEAEKVCLCAVCRVSGRRGARGEGRRG